VTSANKDSEWQELSWKEKIQSCQQHISQEDSLLIAYVVIFIGLEAIFVAVVISSILSRCFDLTIALLGIAVAINFALVCKRRGDAVDRWSVIFYSLWLQVPPDEVIASIELNNKKLVVKAKDIGEDYKGCVKRLAGGWRGWKPIFFGWGTFCERMCNCFSSARRFVIICTPLLVIIAWVIIIPHILDC